MNCETVREYFSDLVEGKVEQAFRVALENHFRSCEACEEEFAAFQRAWDMLESIPWVETPAHLHGRIMSAVRQLKAEQEAERRPAWQGWWDRLTRPVNQKASLGWSLAAAAAIVLVGIAVQVGPNGISMWLSPAVKVSQVTAQDNLLAAQVIPDAVASKDGTETVTISVKSPKTDVRVRVYALENRSAAGWQPWMLSSLTPANGLTLVADTEVARSPVASEVFSRKLQRDRSRGVDVLLVRLTAGGSSRSLAIFRPTSPGLEPKATPARQMDALCSAVYEVARCHQNFIVCEAGLDRIVRLEQGSDSTLYSLDDLARQADLVMDVLPNGVYTLTQQ
mgnify:CR=1 FL=1|jgi:hypothetical protein